MNRLLLTATFVLLFSANHLVAQSNTIEAWTGGFFIDGRWHAVNARFDRQNSTGTADFIAPYFGGAENAINVGLVNLKTDPADLRFTIPARRANIVFSGQQTGTTITGEFARSIVSHVRGRLMSSAR